MLGVRDTRDDADPALAGISSRVDCAVALAPETDMTIPFTAAFYPSVFGGTLEEVPEVYRDASPLAFVDERTVPFLFVHGIPDDAVPVEHSRLMTAALQALGIEVMLVELAGASHFT
ncbi:alpha/beta hydrolase family protein, partial [Escherichia coli]|uniref:alpha/beta hydrolase family protein n=1 Tax=Escherichia coli TaxID=562 RepID=UPI001919EA2C